MWIAIFSFCLFLLFVGIFFYGIQKWDKLLAEPDNPNENPCEPTTTMQRIPVWMLIAGMAIYSLIADLSNAI